MGLPKCFKHFLSCEVTLILRDFKTVTGRFLDFDDKDCRPDSDGERWDDDDKCCKHDDKKHCDDKKHDDKCHKPKMDIKVDIDEECKFVLFELTRDAESVSLQEIECEGVLEIELANVEFEKGTCICINVCDIIYAGMNADIDETEIFLGVSCSDDAVATPAKTS